MNITDELRKEVFYAPMEPDQRGRFDAIADRIDAEHERQLEVLYRDMSDAEYVKLPKGADGVPIRFGDVLDQFGTPMTVFAMSNPDPNQGDCMLELITDGISDGVWVRARKMRHYHAPTVEDVLREFADEVYADADNEIRDRDFLCAKYAKRLKLAEGEDA